VGPAGYRASPSTGTNITRPSRWPTTGCAAWSRSCTRWPVASPSQKNNPCR